MGQEITEDEAIAIARAYVNAALGKDLTIVEAAKSSLYPSEWNIVFESGLSGNEMMEDETLVIVDEDTRLARFFEGAV